MAHCAEIGSPMCALYAGGGGCDLNEPSDTVFTPESRFDQMETAWNNAEASLIGKKAEHCAASPFDWQLMHVQEPSM